MECGCCGTDLGRRIEIHGYVGPGDFGTHVSIDAKGDLNEKQKRLVSKYRQNMGGYFEDRKKWRAKFYEFNDKILETLDIDTEMHVFFDDDWPQKGKAVHGVTMK